MQFKRGEDFRPGGERRDLLQQLGALPGGSWRGLSGVTACGTDVYVPAPVPNDPQYLGYALGVQWAVSCGANPLGTSITNCVSFVITKDALGRIRLAP